MTATKRILNALLLGVAVLGLGVALLVACCVCVGMTAWRWLERMCEMPEKSPPVGEYVRRARENLNGEGGC